MFSVFQSHPINFVAFLLVGLDRVSNQTIENIYVSGIVTYITLALGLRNQVAHLTPMCRQNLLNIDQCLNRGLVRRNGPNEFKIVIISEDVHQFTLPNTEKTSVHNRENWCYLLEDQNETPTPPETHPTPEYHPTPLSDVSSSSFSVDPTNRCNIDYELNTLQREVITLHHTIQNQSDRSIEQMDHLF